MLISPASFLPSLRLPACRDPSFSLAAWQALRDPAPPQQAAPHPAWVVTQREFQRDRSAGLAAPGGPGRLLGISGRFPTSPSAPRLPGARQFESPQRADARSILYKSCGFFGLPSWRPDPRQRTDDSRQRSRLPVSKVQSLRAKGYGAFIKVSHLSSSATSSPLDQLPFSPSQASCARVTPRTRDNGTKQVLEIADCETVRTSAYNSCPEKTQQLLPGSVLMQKCIRTDGVWSRAIV
ncbi:uncharacterized protein LOC120323413 [Pipra filicauda]|uniref:Uncharacterized protein LOC120323413 n=1 Tax=Pipra filicauda TaxID=649802 RepID=A0A7R5KNL1_9PASS|nr:uncharacterized protein LOC120323413 [Pipra filicauda]